MQMYLEPTWRKMNSNNKKQIVLFLGHLSEYYREELSKTMLEMYVNALMEYEADWQKVEREVLKTFDRLPKVSQIIKILLPEFEQSEKQHGIEILNSVIKKITRYGWNNHAEAMANATPEEAQLIRNLGGWSRICNEDFKNPTTYAQARDQAEAIANKTAYLEELYEATELGVADPQKILQTEDTSRYFDPKDFDFSKYEKVKKPRLTDEQLMEKKKIEAQRFLDSLKGEQ